MTSIDSADSMISLRKVSKTYPNGFCAIKPLDLEVARGDIMGIIGYSGAGKSTLIRLINRLENPSSGEVFINGENILTLSQAKLQKKRQKIGMIFQHFNLLSSRSVYGNVAFALEIAKWDKKKIDSRVKELLEIVGLSDKADFYPSQLSGGQKQRVAIARALSNHPDILLCDEATSALDTKTTKSILELLKRIQADLGLTIVLITHQIEVVRQICNKACVMSAGEIIERGSVEEIFSAPRNEVTRELLSYMPTHLFDAQFFSGSLSNGANSLIKNPSNVYKISFVGEHINEPLISEIVQKFGVEINILAGNIEPLSTTKVGHLLVEFSQDKQNELAIDYLKQKGLIIQNLEILQTS
ncbi:methionine ABC transporter ATP-binding protein [Helicobacter sp. MIT 01-3238]|uniref:methionine ABC transporter ATP-binding protein n=1 Tax=Helicobacter sp. MIT 01-3238 TaxID=398627 RepID=UPI0026BF9493